MTCQRTSNGGGMGPGVTTEGRLILPRTSSCPTPIVAMSRTSRDDCESLRMIVSSMAPPTRKPPTIATANAIHQFRPWPASIRTKTAAQSAPTSAWAKLRIPLPRYTSTKPAASAA